MSKEAGFVPLQSYLERGNAQQEVQEPQTATKSGSAWGGAKKQEPAKPLSFAELQEQEAKRKEEEKAKRGNSAQSQASTGTYKPRRSEEPSYSGSGFGGGSSSYGGGSSSYGGGSSSYGGGGSSYGGGGSSYGGSSGSYGGGGGGYGEDRPRREYTPREKNPVPQNPPYTAYIGNLPFEKASEEELDGWFGELGVEEIRVIRDTVTQQPKGYAYIQFTHREGLESALQADGANWGSRNITVDVATTKTREDDRGRWGPREGGGSASGFGRREEGSRFDGRGGGGGGGDRYNNSESRFEGSGPSWRSQNKPATTSAPASSGPPKLDLQPRTKPIEEIGVTAKRAGEDPFAGANSDADKLKRQAEERLRREQESERKQQETLDRIQREREEKARSFGQAAAGTGKPTDSWRGPREEENKRGGHAGGRGGRGGGSSRGRYDNSWGSSDKGEHKHTEKKVQPSKAETERADALVNPYDVLNNDDGKE